MVPDDWSKGVPAPALPSDKTAGEWVSAANAAVGQLDIANSRTHDTVMIVRNCEARDRKVADSLKPKPWWHLGLW